VHGVPAAGGGHVAGLAVELGEAQRGRAVAVVGEERGALEAGDGVAAPLEALKARA